MKKFWLKRYSLVLVVLVLLLLAITAQAYLGALCILLAIYVVDTLLFSDHIYYDPKCDYQFNFSSASHHKARIENGQLLLETGQASDFDSCILALEINASLMGRLFDPYVDIRAGEICSRQYFERGVQGIRYLNLSRFGAQLVDNSEPIKVSAGFCTYKTEDLTLSSFTHADYLSQRALIISPHADDAELAAFGFYKNAASVFIATITAGESLAPGEIKTPAFKRIAKGDLTQACQLKGQLRAWDSVAIPIMAGAQVTAVNLGYFDNTLKKMFAQPHSHTPSASHKLANSKCFRRYNKYPLPNDLEGINSWESLLKDLVAIVREYQPDIIISPHPLLDPHPDHQYATRAALIACEQAQLAPQFLLYANHFHHTGLYPFGPEHSDLPLPPHFASQPLAEKLYSYPLSDAGQMAKVFALQRMHDLNRPAPFKKQLRRWLQRIIGRSTMPYGQDEYLRKAIRQQELFFVSSLAWLKLLLTKP